MDKLYRLCIKSRDRERGPIEVVGSYYSIKCLFSFIEFMDVKVQYLSATISDMEGNIYSEIEPPRPEE